MPHGQRHTLFRLYPRGIITSHMTEMNSSLPRLDDGTKRYYNRVETYLDEEGEDRELFCQNVVKQVCGKDGVARVCCDKDGSRALERLLREKLIDSESMRDLVDGILAEYYQIAKNKCGSHVVEILLKTVKPSESTSTELTEKFHRLCSLLTENLSDFVGHPYASHVISSLIQAVSGVHLSDLISRSRYSQEFRKAKMANVSKNQSKVSIHTIPDSFSELLLKIHKHLYKNDKLGDLLTHQCGSPVIQTLLRVLSNCQPKKAAKLIKKIAKITHINETSDKDLAPVFTHLVGSHLIETVIEVASHEVLDSVYETCFKGRLMSFALHPVANYILQKLLTLPWPDKVPSFVDELASLEEVLFAGHTGVVVKLVEAVTACPDSQDTVLQLLLTAFHAESQLKICAPLFLAMTAYEVYTEEKKDESKTISIHLHGSLIVQALLKYQDTKTVARSLLKMTSDDVTKVSCDQSGSHVLTTFMSSPTVSAKNKLKMVEKLEGDLVHLSKDKHGSRVVDTLWRNCEIVHKDQLAQSLLSCEEELSNEFYGQIVLRNCNIAHYKRKQDSWREEERVEDKKRALFEDIIGEDSVAQTVPRKKRKKLSMQ